LINIEVSFGAKSSKLEALSLVFSQLVRKVMNTIDSKKQVVGMNFFKTDSFSNKDKKL
jgi:hypothetical protein